MPTSIHCAAPILCAALLLARTSTAQSYDFGLDANTSDTNITSSARQDLPGSAIGNYDATTNPTGTKTCTSIFGACNNTAIPMTMALLLDTTFAGAPTGGFRATLDTNAGVALISDLAVDALGGQSGGSDLTLELLYTTFRTQQPNSIYIGGITLPLPLGQAVATNVQIQQTGPAVPGALTPTATPGLFDFTAIVPATLSFDLDVLGNQSSIGPTPFPLTLVGVLDTNGPTPLFSLFVSQTASQKIPDPAPGQAIDDFAFDVPTILPPGDIAHLLLDATFGSLSIDLGVELAWYASGAPACEVSSYCSSTPNTYSAGGRIGASGSSSLLFNDLQLVATDVPPGHAGRFYIGARQGFTPFGDGHLCLAGLTRRFPVVAVDALGSAQYTIDFTDPAQPGALVGAGSTWNFQYVFRDPLGGPLTFNTTDALAITFCP